MTTSSNPNVRSLFGTLVTRPAVVPLGTLYTDTATGIVYQFQPGGWTAVGGGPFGLTGFWVAPAGSPYSAPYSTPQAAVTAAEATGNQETVLILPGTYNGDVVLATSRVSLVGVAGGVGGMSPNVSTDSQVVIVGNVRIDALAGTQSIENMSIHGTLSESGGGVASALVGQLRRVNIFPPNASPPAAAARAISLVNHGQTWLFDEITADTGSAGGIGSGDVALNASGSVTVVAKRSKFLSPSGLSSVFLNGGGSWTSDDVEYGGLITFHDVTTFSMTNTSITLAGVTSQLFTGFAGSTIKIHGYLRYFGLDATGKLCDVAGLVSGDSGVDFGSLQVANLPTNAGAGTTAFCSNLAVAVAKVYYDGANWRRYNDNSIAN